MKYIDVIKLDGKQFQELMDIFKIEVPTFYWEVFNRYFLEKYNLRENPIIDSWNDDPDDVWDAEQYVSDQCDQHRLKDLIKECIEKYPFNE